MRRLLLTGLLASTLNLTARGDWIDLNSLAHGTIVNTQFQQSDGVTVSAENFNRPFHIAGVFDTQQSGTSAPGLEGPPWAGGNLAPTTPVGNVLIIQTNNQIDPNGLLSDPDDEGEQPAGELRLDFLEPVNVIGFDVVDIDTPTQFYAVAFYLNDQLLKRISFPEFINPLSPYYDPTIVFGDNHANRIQPITAADINAEAFDRVVFEMGGSGGVGNIVPEPASLMLLVIGGATLIGRRLL